MSKYKLIGEDESKFTFKHESGKTFDVSKSHVDGQKIKKMYGGGEVSRSPASTTDEALGLQADKQGGQDIFNPGGMIPFQEPTAPQENASYPMVPGSPMNTPTPSMGVDQSTLPGMPQLPGNTGEILNQYANQPEEPNRSPAEAGPYDKYWKMQKQYINQMAGAQSGMAKDQLAAAQDYQKQIANHQAWQQGALKQIDQEQSALENEYKTGKIDPMRVWNNTSTAGQIGAVIAAGLGGMAAGVTGGPNQALGMINKIIDRDIDAQKANMNKTVNLMHINMQKYGNTLAAGAATRMDLLSSYKTQLEAAAARAGTPMAQAWAKGQLAQVELSQAQIGMQLKMLQYKGAAEMGGVPESQWNPITAQMAGLDRKNEVHIDGNVHYAPTPEAAATVNKIAPDAKAVIANLGQIHQIISKAGGTINALADPTTHAKIKAIMAENLPRLREVYVNGARGLPKDLQEVLGEGSDPTNFMDAVLKDNPKLFEEKMGRFIRDTQDIVHQNLPSFKGFKVGGEFSSMSEKRDAKSYLPGQ